MKRLILLLAALAFAGGCGNKKGDDGLGANLVTDSPANHPVAPSLPDLPIVDPDTPIPVDPDSPLAPVIDFANSEAGKLSRFWTFDRFVKDGGFGPLLPLPSLQRKLLAKAEVDECFCGVGEPLSTPLATPLADPLVTLDDSVACPVCDATGEPGLPKRNGGYVWGLGKGGSKIWFGTITNTHCLVSGGNIPLPLPGFETDFYVCEYQDSQSGTGDWRRPKIFSYDLATHSLVDLSPPVGSPAGILLSKTTGVRSVGVSDGVIIFGGPVLNEEGPPNSEGTVGINLFAFDADTGALLAAKSIEAYNNIRTWLNLDGVLYTTVAHSVVVPGEPGGSVLRWRGQKVAAVGGDYPYDPDALFDFEVVGDLDSGGASMVEHLGRIFISTWPSIPAIDPQNPTPLPVLLQNVRVAAIVRGPPVPAGGLTADDAGDWETIWRITDYERDALLPFGTTGGALASYKGDLYWGTMNPPLIVGVFALLSHFQAQAGLPGLNLDSNDDGALDTNEILAALLGTHRVVSIFRARAADQLDPQIELLYGERYLPRYDPTLRSYTIRYDADHENGMGLVPLWGASGFGNFFNGYTWTMEPFDDALFIGTFDHSLVLRAGVQELVAPALGDALPFDFERVEKVINTMGFPNEGADLMRIVEDSGRAFAESFRGAGNFTNYGIRTMIADENALFLGTANPMNLHPKGGWELLEMTPRCFLKPPVVDVDVSVPQPFDEPVDLPTVLP